MPWGGERWRAPDVPDAERPDLGGDGEAPEGTTQARQTASPKAGKGRADAASMTSLTDMTRTRRWAFADSPQGLRFGSHPWAYCL